MTTLSPLMDASALLATGGQWMVACTTRDSYGYRTAAVTPVVTITRPTGVTSTPTVLALATSGDWYVPVLLDTSGRWLAHMSTPEDALDVAAWAAGPVTAAGMPTATDCLTYMTNLGGTWSGADVQGALDAERDAQRNACGERAYYPNDLREALLRRVMRNLAMRRLPLGVNVGDADVPYAVLPGRDPEVRRLEAPYRRLVVG